MAIFGNPENEVSVGLHEKIGPCDEWIEQKTLFTLVTGEVSPKLTNHGSRTPDSTLIFYPF